MARARGSTAPGPLTLRARGAWWLVPIVVCSTAGCDLGFDALVGPSDAGLQDTRPTPDDTGAAPDGGADLGRDQGMPPPDLGLDAGACRAALTACPATDGSFECADLQTDLRHCGTCGSACSGDDRCESGQCVVDCTSGPPHDGARELCNGRDDDCDGTVDETPADAMTGAACRVVEIAAGQDHTCARRASGELWCWGRNERGQLGDGTVVSRREPRAVPGVIDAVQIAARVARTCARRETGEVLCWGTRSGGAGSDPRPSAVRGITDAIDLALGGGQNEAQSHVCVVRATGAALCWGSNEQGQLGDGTTVNRAEPGPEVSGITDAMQIAAGVRHTCALSGSGTVHCWGWQRDGRLGDGVTADVAVMAPVAVADLTGVARLSAGKDHTCALSADGSLRCWGQNWAHQVDVAEPGVAFVDRPTPFAAVSGVADLCAGEGAVCARLLDGGLQCWGQNGLGQLGNGDTVTFVPMQVIDAAAAAIGPVAQVGCGRGHACAVQVEGTVLCWGDDRHGQLASPGTSRPFATLAEGIP